MYLENILKLLDETIEKLKDDLMLEKFWAKSLEKDKEALLSIIADKNDAICELVKRLDSTKPLGIPCSEDEYNKAVDASLAQGEA